MYLLTHLVFSLLSASLDLYTSLISFLAFALSLAFIARNGAQAFCMMEGVDLWRDYNDDDAMTMS